MNATAPRQKTKTATRQLQSSSLNSGGRLLQNKYACNSSTAGQQRRFDTYSSEEESRSTDLSLFSAGQRAELGHEEITGRIDAVLNSSGHSLNNSTRAYMESRFGWDFSNVRIHADAGAAATAKSLNALAYTVGRDVVFDADQYSPATLQGRHLLAHELTHVVQQSLAGNDSDLKINCSTGRTSLSRMAETQAEETADRVVAQGEKPVSLTGMPYGGIQMAESLGTRVANAKGMKRLFKRISGKFDGKDFVLVGDGVELLRAPGQSGRPYTVKNSDAKSCGGAEDDSYMNNPRYVGIADNGPIPEGEYTFARTDMVTFTRTESAKMALAREGEYIDPSGSPLHGDWGAGRVPLKPLHIMPSLFCGKTATRSGFYLHGGVMPGSSGCIDIGNDAMGQVVDKTQGYPEPIVVVVKYSQSTPDVGFMDRAAGRFMYPPGKNPSFGDRINSLFGLGD